jgi:uridine kinase
LLELDCGSDTRIVHVHISQNWGVFVCYSIGMTIDEITSNIKAAPPPHTPILIAVEGYGGAGKTTFADGLARELGSACVIHMDDFIVKEKLLTEPSWDSGFDTKRLEDQILRPIRAGTVAKYQKLIWADNSLGEYVTVPKVQYIIVEGISAYHPTIAHYYDHTIWIDTPIAVAKERGHNRDGSNENARHWDLWAQNDLRYQEKYHPELMADFTFKFIDKNIFNGGSSTLTEKSRAWSKMGPESYFPSIEKKYGRSIAEWQKIIDECGLEKHMAIVNYLKANYQMGHGHANALVGWTLAGNRA